MWCMEVRVWSSGSNESLVDSGMCVWGLEKGGLRSSGEDGYGGVGKDRTISR